LQLRNEIEKEKKLTTAVIEENKRLTHRILNKGSEMFSKPIDSVKPADSVSRQLSGHYSDVSQR